MDISQAWDTGLWFCIAILIVSSTKGTAAHSSGNGNEKRKNVLLIISDDLRPELGSYVRESGHCALYPDMHTPNLDRLASSSLLLKRAYVQQSLCGPSRTSFLTGRRPDTTRVYDVTTCWRDSGGDFTTLPQHFKESGYDVRGMGKVFHPTDAGGYDPPSWSVPFLKESGYPDIRYEHSWRAVPSNERATDPALQDDVIVEQALKTLQEVAPKALAAQTDNDDGQPFFLAVGFHKPHLPFIFPEEFLEYYPEDKIFPPFNPNAPVDLPHEAWSSFEELLEYEDIKELHLNTRNPTSKAALPARVVLQLRRAYYASVSYMDHNVGLVLEELDRLGLADSTVVAFLGDHGYQLGEHGEWCKHTNFDVALRTPLMVRVPGLTDAGVSSEELVEFIDLFPTLVEAAGLDPLPLCPDSSSSVKLCREGSSFMPLLEKRDDDDDGTPPAWKRYVFSQYPWPHLQLAPKRMGYSVRNDRFRYVEWVGFQPDNRGEVYGLELYDLERDPEQRINRASDPDLKDTLDDLHAVLQDGWRAVLPPGE